MRVSHLLAVASAAVLASAAMPAAATDYNFTYGFNGVTIASGTIQTDSTVLIPGASNVVLVMGQRMGESISGFQDFFNVDNGDQQLYPNRPLSYVDELGLTFQVGLYSYNITSPSFSSGSGPSGLYTEYRYLTSDPFGPQQSQLVSFFTLTPVGATAGVPEPATWALMIAGFGGIGAAMRRRRAKISVSFA